MTSPDDPTLLGSAVAAVRHVAALAEGKGGLTDEQVAEAVTIMLDHEAQGGESADQRRVELAQRAKGPTEEGRRTRDRIVVLVQRHVRAILERLSEMDLEDLTDEEEAVAAARAADSVLADYLEEAGEFGAVAEQIAAFLRQGVETRQSAARTADTAGPSPLGRSWSLWIDPGSNPNRGRCPFVTWLAMAVWRDVEMQQVAEERQKNLLQHYPAVTVPQRDALGDALFGASRELVLNPDGRLGDILDADGKVVGHMAPGAPVAEVDQILLEGMRRNLRATRKVGFIRTFNYLACAAHAQKAANPDNLNYRTVWIDHAFQGLAERARVRKQQEVADALRIGQCLLLPLADGMLGGLWSFRSWRGNQYRPGMLLVELAREIVQSGGHREPLVPLLPPDREPALPRDGALHAPALIAIDYLLQWLRAHAIELHDYGAVTFGDRDWEDIVARVDPGFRARERKAILGPLRDGDDRRPPLLVFPEPRTLTLNPDEYGDVLAFLRKGGRLSRKGQKDGRKAAQIRSRKGASGKKRGRR